MSAPVSQFTATPALWFLEFGKSGIRGRSFPCSAEFVTVSFCPFHPGGFLFSVRNPSTRQDPFTLGFTGISRWTGIRVHVLSILFFQEGTPSLFQESQDSLGGNWQAGAAFTLALRFQAWRCLLGDVPFPFDCFPEPTAEYSLPGDLREIMVRGARMGGGRHGSVTWWLFSQPHTVDPWGWGPKGVRDLHGLHLFRRKDFLPWTCHRGPPRHQHPDHWAENSSHLGRWGFNWTPCANLYVFVLLFLF